MFACGRVELSCVRLGVFTRLCVCVRAQKHSSILFTAFALNKPPPSPHTPRGPHLFLHKLQGARATQEKEESLGRENAAAAAAAAAAAGVAATRGGGGGGAAAEHGDEVGSVEHGGAGESDADFPESDVNMSRAKLGQLHLVL